MEGGSFTTTVKVTENVALSLAVDRSLSRPPSSTVTVMTAEPLAAATGVNRRLPVVSADVYVTAGSGIKPVLLLDAVTFSGCVSPPPAVIPLRLTVCSAAFCCSCSPVKVLIVGASLTGATVTRKVRVTVRLSPAVDRLPSRPASSTTTVMTAVPL